MSGILGLDLSLNGAAFALIDVDPEERERKLKLIPAGSSVHGVPNGMLVRINVEIPKEASPAYQQKYRWDAILEPLLMLASGVRIVLLEGYAFGTAFHREDLAEIGGIVRWNLAERFQVYPQIVNLTVIKKFLTGKGAADKDIMLKECYKRYSVDVDDHNMVDAFILAQIGHALVHGTGGLMQFQAEVIEKLQAGPKPKKVKKRHL